MWMRLLTRLYANLLRLYPARFADEFGGEMAAVFSRRLSGLDDPGTAPLKRRVIMTRLLIREIWDFPHSYIEARRYQAQAGGGEAPAGGAAFGAGAGIAPGESRPASWSAAFLGALPFLLHGLVYLIKGVNELDGPGPPFFFPEGGFLADPQGTIGLLLANSTGIYRLSGMVMMFVIGLVLLFGVRKGFPRWSFAYLGMCVYFGWFSSGLWGWVPLFAPVFLGLLLNRSMQPLTRLLQGVWNDWTRLSFAFYAFGLPILTIIFFDDPVWGLAQLYGLLFDTVMLAAGAVVFLRTGSVRDRILALATPVLVLVVKGGLAGSWWDGQAGRLLMYFAMYMLFLLVPAAIGALRQIAADSRLSADR